jgi:hypothetical protein
MAEKASSKTKRFTPMGVVFALVGLALFAYFVRKAGFGDILAGIRRLGFGFLIVVAIAGVRKVVRAFAWTRCFESVSALRFRDALGAVIAADALGTLMPLGMVVSEPAKAALVRVRVPLIVGLSSVAIENLFYSLSVAIFIFCGTTAMLFTFPLPKALRIASVGALVAVTVILVIAFFVVRKQWRFLSGLVEFLYGRGIGKRVLEDKRDRVRGLEDRVYGFYSRHQSRFLIILLLEACFHLSGVLEGYVTLSFLGGIAAPTLLAAFILESVNRVITVVFKFIPLRLGVDEAGSSFVAKVLHLGSISGVTLAIVRKARDIVWTAIGVALLIRRGLSPAKVAEESQVAVAAEVSAASAAAGTNDGEVQASR